MLGWSKWLPEYRFQGERGFYWGMQKRYAYQEYILQTEHTPVTRTQIKNLYPPSPQTWLSSQGSHTLTSNSIGEIFYFCTSWAWFLSIHITCVIFPWLHVVVVHSFFLHFHDVSKPQFIPLLLGIWLSSYGHCKELCCEWTSWHMFWGARKSSFLTSTPKWHCWITERGHGSFIWHWLLGWWCVSSHFHQQYENVRVIPFLTHTCHYLCSSF